MYANEWLCDEVFDGLKEPMDKMDRKIFPQLNQLIIL